MKRINQLIRPGLENVHERHEEPVQVSALTDPVPMVFADDEGGLEAGAGGIDRRVSVLISVRRSALGGALDMSATLKRMETGDTYRINSLDGDDTFYRIRASKARTVSHAPAADRVLTDKLI